MSETTSPSPPPSETTPETAAPSEAAAAALETGELTVRSLLEAGVHFGHQTRRWNPRMRPFIFGERNGIHILDLDQTLSRFQAALEFLHEVTASGGSVLFVGTKTQAQAPIRLEAERSGQFYVNNRWLGGMLTNFRTVRKSIDRFKERLALLEDEERVAELSKKERSRVVREVEKYRKALEGIREMGRLPSALFVVDINREHIAISEAERLDIPIVAVVDTNCDPDRIDYPIPGNDDAIRAIQLYCARVADACLAGAQVHDERVRSEVTEEAAGHAAPGAAPTTGRVVVEIKQPPRRGRGGTRSAGGRRRPQEAPAAAPAATPEPAPAATPAAEPQSPPAAGPPAGPEGETSS